jgi:5-methylcytosine-specific restriction endonuclease McrA
LGVKKYLYGEVKKHKAWIRAQAIKKYGKQCELCGYSASFDAHHIVPKYAGGKHEIENLMIVCPNCHALITRLIIKLKNRKDIPVIRKKVLQLIPSFY